MRSPDGVLFNIQEHDEIEPEPEPEPEPKAVEPDAGWQYTGEASPPLPSTASRVARRIRQVVTLALGLAAIGVIGYAVALALVWQSLESGPKSGDPTEAGVAHTIAFEHDSVTLLPGSSTTLRLTGSLSEVPLHQLTWSSNAPKIATVDHQGRVKAVSHGSAVITAHEPNGSSAYATIIVLTPVMKVEIDTVSPATRHHDWYLNLRPGSTLRLRATLRDSAGVRLVGRKVTWRSDDTMTVTVSHDGIVTAKGTTGRAVISAKSERAMPQRTLCICEGAE
jgi:Bacterial Ig-like domain (group 2)